MSIWLNEFKNKIAELPVEKRSIISELIHEASLAINSVECELHDTELQGHSLFDGDKHPTLWCQLHSLRQLFKEIQ